MITSTANLGATSTSESAAAPTNTPASPEPSGDKPQAARDLRYYRQILVPLLDPKIFQPNMGRLIPLGACVLVSLCILVAMAELGLAWPTKLVLGLALGFCTGSMAFLGHEILHGSVVKSSRWQMFLGFFATMPFLIAPTYWKFTHNRLHHGKAQRLGLDPDAFPNLRLFRQSSYLKAIFPFTPGSGHKRSYLYFFFWFALHNFMAQVRFRFENKIYEGLNQRRATIELIGQSAIVAGLMLYVGPSNWLWAMLIPFMVQNYLLMSYISTNHNLSPLTSENDPLANSLSVTNHPLLEYLNLDFGYHVEHHIFPTLSGKHIKQVHRLLVEKFPDTYKIMPKWQAIKALYKTARIYKNSRELINPETLEVYPTL